MAVFFALLSAFLIGLNTIVIKKSLNRAPTFSVAVMLTTVGTIFFWVITLIGYPNAKIGMNIKACIYFTIAGLFAPGLLRLIFFVGIKRVGVSIASSIIATIPAFAAVIMELSDIRRCPGIYKRTRYLSNNAGVFTETSQRIFYSTR